MLNVILLCGFVTVAFSQDFGKRGTTFFVAEEGFVEMIMRKLQSVDLNREEQKMKSRAKTMVENPTPVYGVMPALKAREFFFDPTYILKEDAILPCGKVLHREGTKVNPLDHMNLQRRLYFVDGRDFKQLEWLGEQLTNHMSNNNAPQQEEQVPLENRIILVAGSPLKLQERFNVPIYFDQSGELTTKFGIKASPAVARQEGKMLKIIEFNLSEESNTNG